MKKLLTVLLVIAVICTFSFGSAFATVNYQASKTNDKIAVDDDFFNKTEASANGTVGTTGSLGITTAEAVYLADNYDFTVLGVYDEYNCTCTAEAKEIKAVLDALLADLAKATTSQAARKLENTALKNIDLIQRTYAAYEDVVEANAVVEIDRTTSTSDAFLLKGYGYVVFGTNAVSGHTYEYALNSAAKFDSDGNGTLDTQYEVVDTGEELMVEWLLDNGYTTKASLAAGTAKLFAALEEGKVWTAELAAAYKEAKAAVKTVNTATTGFGSSVAATASLDEIEAALAKVDAYITDFAVANTNDGTVGTVGSIASFDNTGWKDGLTLTNGDVTQAAVYAIENLLVTDYAGIKALNKSYALMTDAEKAEVVKQVRSITENKVAFMTKYDHVDDEYLNSVDSALVADDNISQLMTNFAQIVNAKETEIEKVSAAMYVTTPEVAAGYTGTYTFDTSAANLAAIKNARAAFDALVADYGWTVIAGYDPVVAEEDDNFLKKVGAFEARVLAAEYNVNAVAGIDKKNDADSSVAIQAYLNNANVKATSSKLAAKKVRVQAKVDSTDFAQLMDLVSKNHYTLEYKFYHKAPSKSFKLTKTKGVNYITYTSKSLKKGKNSFRVGLVVKDADGNVVAEKSYQASSLAYRTIK